MRKKIKKAFTLVELLVVIAILAILATVSIVGYNSFTKKAKVSNDTALVSQLNTLLKADSMVNGDAKTPTDALKITSEAGYDVEKLTPTTNDYEIIWNQAVNQFALLDEHDSVVYGEKNTDEYKNWKFVSEYDANSTYSMYLKNNTSITSINNLKVGLDVGTNATITEVNYTNSDSKNDVVIRTNNGTLNVNAATDTIKHFGSLDKVVITAVAPHSYYENGTVSGNIEISSGRVEIAKNAEVDNVIVTGNDVKVEFKDKDSTTNVMVSDSVAADKQPEVIGKEFKADENKIIVVNSYDELKKAVFSTGGNIALGSDIKTSSALQIREDLLKGSHDVVLNLNGHTYTYRSTTASSSNAAFSVKSNTSFLIKGNGSILVPEDRNARLFDVYVNGILTIDGGCFLTPNNSTSNPMFRGGYDTTDGGEIVINGGAFISNDVCFGLWKSTKLTINNGNFTTNDNFIIGSNGSSEYGNNKIVINGGTFNANIVSEGYIACGIYAANNDSWNINGGTFNITNGCGILGRSGTVNVSKNVKINLFNDENNQVKGKVGDANVMVISGAAIVKDNVANYPGGAPTINNNSNYTVTELNQYEA